MPEYWYYIDQFVWNEEGKFLEGDEGCLFYPGSLVTFPNKGRQFFVKNNKTNNFRRFRLLREFEDRWVFESEDNIKCIVKKQVNNMTKETLKQLIEIEFERAETISHFKKEVFRLIDLYDEDKSNININPVFIPVSGEPDEVPFHETCSCNPKNGGSGICGCIMANQMVKNPKKYGHPTSNIGTHITTNFEAKE